MPTPFRVLIVEDNPDDAALMVAELRRSGFAPVWQRVETEAAFLDQLDRSPDLILADYSLPQFDGLTALRLMRERGLDVPFVIVSGSIGEELAVAAMKSGAADYLLKDRLTRLGGAVDQALKQHELLAAQRRSEAAYRFLNEVGRVLTSSLDYRITIRALARLVAPAIADRCEIFVSRDEDGHIVRMAGEPDTAGEHAGPGEPETSGAVGSGVPLPVVRVLQSGEAECWLEGAANEETSGRVSAICVPMAARGRLLGAIAFAAMAGRHFDRVEIGLFEEIGRLAALAIDNGRLYQEAQDALGTRDQFLSIAAHELRTPVTEIKGFAQLLAAAHERGEADGPRQVRYARRIVEGCERLTKLAVDLLDARYIQEGDLPLRIDAIDLATLVGEVARRHQEHLGPRHPVEIDESGERCVVLADVDRVEQVLINLLTNAAKFSPDGGPIRVALAHDRGGVHLTVKDQGIGVPQGMAEAIFTPFTRASNSRDRSLPGLGLGLSLCRTIMERHGGRIWAESAGEGRGTTINIWFPTVERPADPSPTFLEGAGDSQALQTV